MHSWSVHCCKLGAAAAVALAACGGDGSGGGGGPGAVTATGTLAYVVTDCSENADAAVATQKLLISRAEGEPVLAAPPLELGPVAPVGLCPVFGEGQAGWGSSAGLPFQRLSVSPDGSTVAFEVTDDFSILGQELLDAEEEGIFVVQADGTGLRRLGPASREAAFRVVVEPAVPTGLLVSTDTRMPFSPDGKTIAFTDVGPGPLGEDAVQIFTLDLATGARRQITRLPPLEPKVPTFAAVGISGFVDENSITFITETAPQGLTQNLVDVDGDGEVTILETPVAVPGATLVPEFTITGVSSSVSRLGLPGAPENPLTGAPPVITEVFVTDGDNSLQLTNFGRTETALSGGALLSRDRRRVLFSASADPLGTNPLENCQFFSVDALGGDLRQLTDFDDGEKSQWGCFFQRPGCQMNVVGLDAVTDTVLFYTNCDPFDRGYFGGQIFAMEFDGSGLRQLTETRGRTVDADGTVRVELPGPSAYSGVVR